MSIKLSIQAPGLDIHAVVTDEALTDLIQITQKYRDQEFQELAAPLRTASVLEPKGSLPNLGEDATKARLSSYGAAELLNALGWDTNSEKILLLGAWHEARGGNTPWKSADMDDVFLSAKEQAPANFPRDIKTAIKSGWVHTHTPRTYSVTRTGWNRIADSLSKVDTPI
jgi:hypothetical protein